MFAFLSFVLFVLVASVMSDEIWWYEAPKALYLVPLMFVALGAALNREKAPRSVKTSRLFGMWLVCLSSVIIVVMTRWAMGETFGTMLGF